VPVAIETVSVDLPKEYNIPTQTKPENITIAVDADGNVFWNRKYVPNGEELFVRMKLAAVQVPQPEIHIRGDRRVRYQEIGKVVVTCQRAGIRKIGFITEPLSRG
jgi:biopolymer transport protein ExbD